VFKPPKAIRGGVPVCWPQFSDFGPLGQHGFARNMVRQQRRALPSSLLSAHTAPAQAWELLSSGGTSPHGAFVELGLRDSDATRDAWPHAFALRLRVSLSTAGALRMDFAVENTGGAPLSFTFALHTYFAVADASAASVRGLAGSQYLDSLQSRARFTEQAAAVVFDQEARARAACTSLRADSSLLGCPSQVDRIYLAVPSSLALEDAAAKRTFTVAMRNLPDAVVWNPWVAKSAAMADFGAAPLSHVAAWRAYDNGCHAGDEEYKGMVCIEAAAIEHPVSVAAGATWEAGQTLTAEKLA
jgi:glucose-6-phosphate 1-epimerase